jgi:hypothetical protein
MVNVREEVDGIVSMVADVTLKKLAILVAAVQQLKPALKVLVLLTQIIVPNRRKTVNLTKEFL